MFLNACFWEVQTCIIIEQDLFFFQIQLRFIVNLPSYTIRVINKDGVKDLPSLKPKPIGV